jgi:hypothetical protein
MISRLMLTGIALALGAAPAQAKILTREPPLGALQEGETVLVDNGQCPKGEIMAVTGGNHVKVGGTKQIVRTRACVKAPN